MPCAGIGDQPCPNSAVLTRTTPRGPIAKRCEHCRPLDLEVKHQVYEMLKRARRQGRGMVVDRRVCEGDGELGCPDRAMALPKTSLKGYWPKRCLKCKLQAIRVQSRARSTTPRPHAVFERKGIDYSKTEYVGRAELQQLSREAGLLKEKI